jgi:hypothetical protein
VPREGKGQKEKGKGADGFTPSLEFESGVDAALCHRTPKESEMLLIQWVRWDG